MRGRVLVKRERETCCSSTLKRAWIAREREESQRTTGDPAFFQSVADIHIKRIHVTSSEKPQVEIDLLWGWTLLWNVPVVRRLQTKWEGVRETDRETKKKNETTLPGTPRSLANRRPSTFSIAGASCIALQACLWLVVDLCCKFLYFFDPLFIFP